MDGTEVTRRRVLSLEPIRSTALALVCAQALVRASSDRDTELNEAISHGWDIAEAQRSALTESDRIARRPDIDEDAVAATFYALRAVDGSTEDAWRAVSRFVDSAFEQAEYPNRATQFRPLVEDNALPDVRLRMHQLETWLRAAESSMTVGELIEQLALRRK
jgi:hypothetical protein